MRVTAPSGIVFVQRRVEVKTKLLLTCCNLGFSGLADFEARMALAKLALAIFLLLLGDRQTQGVRMDGRRLSHVDNVAK